MKEKAKLSPLQKMLIEKAEKIFPEISESHCSERENGLCKITEKVCKLRGCPKIQEAGDENRGSFPMGG